VGRRRCASIRTPNTVARLGRCCGQDPPRWRQLLGGGLFPGHVLPAAMWGHAQVSILSPLHATAERRQHPLGADVTVLRPSACQRRVFSKALVNKMRQAVRCYLAHRADPIQAAANFPENSRGPCFAGGTAGVKGTAMRQHRSWFRLLLPVVLKRRPEPDCALQA